MTTQEKVKVKAAFLKFLAKHEPGIGMSDAQAELALQFIYKL